MTTQVDSMTYALIVLADLDLVNSQEGGFSNMIMYKIFKVVMPLIGCAYRDNVDSSLVTCALNWFYASHEMRIDAAWGLGWARLLEDYNHSTRID